MFVHALPSTIQFSKSAPSPRFGLVFQGVFVGGKKKFYSLRPGLSRSNIGLLLKLCVSLNSPGFIQMSLLLSGSALFQILFGIFSVAFLENNPLLRGKKKLYGKVERRARGFGKFFEKVLSAYFTPNISLSLKDALDDQRHILLVAIDLQLA